MPVLASFGAISVRLYPGDHAPPHVHIAGPGFTVQVRFSDLQIIEGRVRRAQIADALAWVNENRDFVLQQWRDFGGAQR